MDRSFLLLIHLAILLTFMAPLVTAYDFYVGGEKGWVEKPDKSYNLWAQSMRFQVNDKLVFKYKKDDDCVLVVNMVDYNSCNTTNPIKKFNDGNTVFLLDHSGPFYFISGETGHCADGQKLEVVVMAIRDNPIPPPTPSPSPSSLPSPSPPFSPVPSKAASLPLGTAFSLFFGSALSLLFCAAVVFG